MKKLAQYKKIYIIVLIAILLHITLLIFGNLIFDITNNAYVIVFNVICYFPLFSIVYSILSYKFCRRVWVPFLIYTVLTVVFFVFMFGISMFFAEDPLATSSALTLLEGLYLYVFVTAISALVSIAIVLILLLSFKTVNILRTKSKKSWLFAATFDASYKRSIIPDVSNGFSTYIKSKL